MRKYDHVRGRTSTCARVGLHASTRVHVRCVSEALGSVYRARSCTSVFIAGKFLFVPSDTFESKKTRM